MAEYTEEQSDTIRAGVMGAAILVSKADGGFFQQFKESAAAARQLQQLPPDLRAIFAEFDVPQLSPGNELNLLSQAVAIVDAADPANAQVFRDAVLQVVQAAAEAAGGGVAESEQSVIDQVRHVLETSKHAPGADTDAQPPAAL